MVKLLWLVHPNWHVFFIWNYKIKSFHYIVFKMELEDKMWPKNEGPWILQLMHCQTTDPANFALLINLSTTDTDSSLRLKPTCCSTADLLVFWRSTNLSAHYSTQYPSQCLLTQMHPNALHFVYKLYTDSNSTSMSFKRNYSQKPQSLIVPQTLVPIQYPLFCCNKSSATCQTQRKIKRHS
jgi:hypothetical protein